MKMKLSIALLLATLMAVVWCLLAGVVWTKGHSPAKAEKLIECMNR
jgi:hypothetical protein